MTNDDMARVAEILRKQLRASAPEFYRFTWSLVFDLFRDFELWFSKTDPDFLPNRFYELVFGEYPVDLYG
jgi:hypothetical protein